MINRKNEKAIITGPTGAIGIALCKYLANKNIKVFAICRPNSARSDYIPNHENITKVFCDISELQKLSDLIPDGADAFYHFAWADTIGAGRNDMDSQMNNIRYTLDAVRVAGKLGCKVFIGAGSQAEYGRVEGALTSDTPCNPENGYGIAKFCAGKMSRIESDKIGMSHFWVRILSVYGPYDGPMTMTSSVIRQLLSSATPALTKGEQIWDYLYSEDAAEAFYLIAEHGSDSKTYVLGSGEGRPLKEYIIELRNAINPDLLLGFGEIPYNELSVRYLIADISELQKDVGFIPKTKYCDGIRNTIDFFRRQNNG